MAAVAAQERHEIAEPVAELEAEHVDEELHRRLMVGRMQHDVADVARDAFPFDDIALVATRDARRHFERQTIGREEAEAIAAAEALERLGREDDLAAGVDDALVERCDIGIGLGRQRDHVDAIVLGFAQPHDVQLLVAMRR